MKRQNTRDRILVACRKLFNAKGVVAVTTAGIADAVGINEGNLYYYFKKKSDVVTALFDEFSEEQLAVASQDKSLHEWFQLMWEWRFFYRDSVAIFNMEPALRGRLKRMSDQVQGHGREKLKAMVRDGQLNASDEQLEILLENCWIISTYWLEYLHSRHGLNRITKKHLTWGYRQMSALFQPYLVRTEKADSSAERLLG